LCPVAIGEAMFQNVWMALMIRQACVTGDPTEDPIELRAGKMARLLPPDQDRPISLKTAERAAKC